MKTAILGIDPGSSSGAMCLYEDGRMTTINMPDTHLDMFRAIQNALDPARKLVAIMENVGGSRPGNAAKSARTFAEHVGALKMALIALGVTSYAVMPRKWMVDVCGTGVPTGSQREQVKARKEYIYASLQKLYPTDQFTKRQADAVGLMHYGRLLDSKGELL